MTHDKQHCIDTLCIWAANSPDLPSCPNGVVLSDYLSTVCTHPFYPGVKLFPAIDCTPSVPVWPVDVRLRNVVAQ